MSSLQIVEPAVNDAPLFDWRAHLRVHPAAELFPLMKDMDPAGFESLVENIRAHGLVELIVGWASKEEGQFVLDGRNRLDALAQLGLLYETIDHHVGIKKWTGSKWSDRPGGRIDGHDGAFRNIYERPMVAALVEGLDPYEIALSLNVHRRHLTPEQKRDLIAELLKATPEKSNRQIADEVKADHKTVGKVRAEKEATGEIPQLKKTTGKDGKARPAKSKNAATVTTKVVAKTPDAEATAAQRKTENAAMFESEEQPLEDNFETVERPEQIKVNILDTVDCHCAVVRAYKKILKVSSLEQETKDEISTAIGRLIIKWRSLQAALAPDDAAASAAAMKAKPAAPRTAEEARTEVIQRASSGEVLGHADVKAIVNQHAAATGEASVAGADHPIPDDLSIPRFLNRTPTESTRG
jgi:hypothetical protein